MYSSGSRPPPARQPNYALGLLLNIALPGSGFGYLGLWGWHLAWLLMMGLMWLVTALLVAAIQNILVLLLPLLAYLSLLAHYHVTYQRLSPAGFPAVSETSKLILIAGHFILNLAISGILAAVLIPNLLAARARAGDAAIRNCAVSIQIRQKEYRADHQTYAAQAQLSGVYDPGAACKSNGVKQLAVPTKDTFALRLTGANNHRYTVTQADVTSSGF